MAMEAYQRTRVVVVYVQDLIHVAYFPREVLALERYQDGVSFALEGLVCHNGVGPAANVRFKRFWRDVVSPSFQADYPSALISGEGLVCLQQVHLIFFDNICWLAASACQNLIAVFAADRHRLIITRLSPVAWGRDCSSCLERPRYPGSPLLFLRSRRQALGRI